MARILLIDDDPDFSEALAAQLERVGHEMIRLSLAEKGLDLLVAEPFDLVLLDNKMPRMSGLEFRAARRERGLSVPVILMASAPNDQTVIQATYLGAFGYVTKPLGYDEIMAELEPTLRQALEVTRRPEPVKLPAPDRKNA